MERFSVDESGYTGFDLLNSDQRFQGASAISIPSIDFNGQKKFREGSRAAEAIDYFSKHFPK